MRIEENLVERIERAVYIKRDIGRTSNSERQRMLSLRYEEITKEIQEKLKVIGTDNLVEELINTYGILTNNVANQIETERGRYNIIMKESREKFMIEIEKLKNDNSGLRSVINNLMTEKGEMAKRIEDIMGKLQKKS